MQTVITVPSKRIQPVIQLVVTPALWPVETIVEQACGSALVQIVPSTSFEPQFSCNEVRLTGLPPYHEVDDANYDEIQHLFASGQFPPLEDLLYRSVIVNCWTFQYSSADEVLWEIAQLMEKAKASKKLSPWMSKFARCLQQTENSFSDPINMTILAFSTIAILSWWYRRQRCGELNPGILCRSEDYKFLQDLYRPLVLLGLDDILLVLATKLVGQSQGFPSIPTLQSKKIDEDNQTRPAGTSINPTKKKKRKKTQRNAMARRNHITAQEGRTQPVARSKQQ